MRSASISFDRSLPRFCEVVLRKSVRSLVHQQMTPLLYLQEPSLDVFRRLNVIAALRSCTWVTKGSFSLISMAQFLRVCCAHRHGFAVKTANSTAGAVANREVFEMWVCGWVDDLVFVVSVEDMLPPFCEEIRSAQDTEPRLSCLHIGPRRSMCNCQPWS
jgi:hypothetical protein